MTADKKLKLMKKHATKFGFKIEWIKVPEEKIEAVKGIATHFAYQYGFQITEWFLHFNEWDSFEFFKLETEKRKTVTKAKLPSFDITMQTNIEIRRIFKRFFKAMAIKFEGIHPVGRKVLLGKYKVAAPELIVVQDDDADLPF